MPRSYLRLAIVVLLTLSLGSSALAQTSAEVVDQAAEQPCGCGILIAHDESGNAAVAQSFMAGLDGSLTAVEVFFSTSLPSTVTFAVTPVDALTGFPVDPALAVATLPAEAQVGDTWYRFEFTEPPLLTQDVQYAIVVTIEPPTEGEIGWAFSQYNTYDRGEFLVKRYADSDWVTGQADWGNITDLTFRTFVVPAQPADPGTLLAALNDEVQRLDAPDGLVHSLTAKLDAARAAWERGDLAATQQPLAAMLRQVSAQDGKALTAEQAESLDAALRTILEQLAA